MGDNKESSADSKLVAISPSKHMLEAQSIKRGNLFSGKQSSLLNTRPMFLGSRPYGRRSSNDQNSIMLGDLYENKSRQQIDEYSTAPVQSVSG